MAASLLRLAATRRMKGVVEDVRRKDHYNRGGDKSTVRADK